MIPFSDIGSIRFLLTDDGQANLLGASTTLHTRSFGTVDVVETTRKVPKRNLDVATKGQRDLAERIALTIGVPLSVERQVNDEVV